MAKFQCLRTLVAELSSLENRLFLANVTMRLTIPSAASAAEAGYPERDQFALIMLWYDQGEDSDADADDTIKPPWSDCEIVKIAFGAESCGHEL
jgi:hypothetical protein